MCHFDMEDMCVTCEMLHLKIPSQKRHRYVPCYIPMPRCKDRLLQNSLCNPTSHRELGGIVNTQKAYHIHQVTHSSKKVYSNHHFNSTASHPTPQLSRHHLVSFNSNSFTHQKNNTKTTKSNQKKKNREKTKRKKQTRQPQNKSLSLSSNIYT